MEKKCTHFSREMKRNWVYLGNREKIGYSERKPFNKGVYNKKNVWLFI